MTTKLMTILNRPIFTLTPRQLAGTHAVLQAFDCITTVFLVSHLGADVELNPVMRHLFGYGMLLFVLVKVTLGMIVLPTCINYLATKEPKRGVWICRWLAIAYLAVVLNNLAGVATVYMLS